MEELHTNPHYPNNPNNSNTFRLQTIMERVMEELSFDASELEEVTLLG